MNKIIDKLTKDGTLSSCCLRKDHDVCYLTIKNTGERYGVYLNEHLIDSAKTESGAEALLDKYLDMLVAGCYELILKMKKQVNE